jgi:hypothetical protein
MRMTWITGFRCAVLAGLTACGPLQQDNPNATALQGAFSGLTGAVTADGANGAAVGESALSGESQALTRSFIEAQDVDLLRLSIISQDATGLVFFGGANGSKVTWLSLEGVSIVFDNGLLVGTRGFGDDLMGGDVAAAKASLQRGGTHLRTLDFLNGLSQIERRPYQCVSVQTGSEYITIVERTYATTVIEETCSGENESFKNTYWRDGNGVIWQSRQWISSGVGYLGYQRL